MTQFACIFPGQGSQETGMIKDLLDDPLSADVFIEASEALGFDLAKLIMEGPEETLMLTENTQPAILATSFAAWKLLVRTLGSIAMPSYVAGHSLGEFSALAAAGVLELKDALQIVRTRGKLMQDVVPEGVGAMAAMVGARIDKIYELVEESAGGQVLDVANINSPKQIVLSGHKEAVDRAIDNAAKHGVKKIARLRVSAPFHSKLMEPMKEKFEQELQSRKFMAPFCPVVHNVTAWPNTEQRRMVDFLTRQIDSPVKWVESIEFMLEHDVTTFIEVGNGRVLQGLVKKIAGKQFDGVITGFSGPADIDKIKELFNEDS